MNEELRELVGERAAWRCEYCRLPTRYDELGSTLDHIRAQYHHGATEADNLALACFWCNTYKGINAAGYDPLTDEITPLFNPRSQAWPAHFQLEILSGEVVGLTEFGRTTIDVLRMNQPRRCALRRQLSREGVW